MHEPDAGHTESRFTGRTRSDGHLLFTDTSGQVWEVHEVLVSAASPWARGERCLLFRSPGSIRRVWSYPREWYELPPAELETLSWRV